MSRRNALMAYESKDDKLAAERALAREIREHWREWIKREQTTMQEEIVSLLKGATMDDRARVQLACKLIDKMLPNQQETEVKTDGTGNVQIVIHGLERGPRRIEREPIEVEPS